MKKITGITIILAAVLLFTQNTVYSQSYAQDTIWTKVTDQSSGFWKVKFSNNDSIIVGHGYGYSDPTTKFVMFYDANNGNEIFRLPGNNEVFYISNGLKFIRLNNERNCFEIFDSKTYLIIDTLENDGVKIYPYYSVNPLGDRLVTVIQGGLRIYNLTNNKILVSKQFPTVGGLLKITIGQIAYNCDNLKIILNITKLYQISDSQPKQVEITNNIVINSNTLDSIENFASFNDFRISKQCKFIAFKTGDPTYGVEIYDFNTKQLLHRLPINGPSLTGIEFSPDDKYIVTSGHGIIIWDVNTGQQNHFYPGDWQCIDISHDGKEIISNGSQDFWKWKSRFSGTPVPNFVQNGQILYPNPSNGEVNIDNIVTEKIKIYNTNGVIQATITPINSDSGIQFNVSNLPNGEYLISIEGKENKTYKLIINK